MAAVSPPPGAPEGSPDWPALVAERIETAVGTVRHKTTDPIVQVARAVVYGLFLGAVAAALAFCVVIAVVRICDVYLPFHPVGRRVWVVYAGGSAIFLLAGLFCWRKRRPRTT
jgi:uncharacterized YccA/Bax inhibitor family protein